MDFLQLSGKTILVAGVANRKSVAFHIAALLERIASDPTIPASAQAMFAVLGRRIDAMSEELAALDRTLAAQHKANPVSRQLAGVPGIGPLGALSLALTVDISQFQRECTPSYFNGEGAEKLRWYAGETYGPGWVAFQRLLQEWRDKGTLEGLVLTGR